MNSVMSAANIVWDNKNDGGCCFAAAPVSFSIGAVSFSIGAVYTRSSELTVVKCGICTVLF